MKKILLLLFILGMFFSSCIETGKIKEKEKIFNLDNTIFLNKNLDNNNLSFTNNLTLVAKKGKFNYDNKNIDFYSYNNLFPGPTIKAKKGTSLKLNLMNGLDYDTSIHWHGLQLKNEFDGTFTTQEAVKSNENFSYEIEFRNNGIYWYHPHFDSISQIDLGLYGAIIVEDENNNIKSDKDKIIFLDDFRFDGKKVLTQNTMHDVFMSGKYGNTYVINGEKSYNFNAKKGDVIRLRLINPSNARVYNFGLENLDLIVIGHDIELLKKPYKTKILSISPGDRFDVLVYIDELKNFQIRNYQSINKFDVLGSINVFGENKNLLENKKYITKILNSNLNKDFEKYFENDEIEKTFDIKFELSGNMMNAKWFFNGKSLIENPQVLKLEEGKRYKFRLINLDMHPHPIHIHGQKFVVTNRTLNIPNTILKGLKTLF